MIDLSGIHPPAVSVTFYGTSIRVQFLPVNEGHKYDLDDLKQIGAKVSHLQSVPETYISELGGLDGNLIAERIAQHFIKKQLIVQRRGFVAGMLQDVDSFDS